MNNFKLTILFLLLSFIISSLWLQSCQKGNPLIESTDQTFPNATSRTACSDSLTVTIGDSSRHMFHYGQFHNDMLKELFSSTINIDTTSGDSCDWFLYIRNFVNDQVQTGVTTAAYEDFITDTSTISCSSFASDYYPFPYDISSEFFETDSILQYSLDGIGTLHNNNLINSDEKDLLIDFVNDLVDNNIDSCYYVNEWNDISNKVYEGTVSGVIIAIGLSADYYWHNVHNQNEVVAILRICIPCAYLAAADTAGAIAGVTMGVLTYDGPDPNESTQNSWDMAKSAWTTAANGAVNTSLGAAFGLFAP